MKKQEIEKEKLGEFELNKIYCMDCLEGLKKIPDNSVDLVLTDPPYGIGCAEWDMEVPSKEIFKEIFRVSKNQIFFGGNYFDLPKTNAWVIWCKKPFLKTSSEAELIWTSFNIKMRVLHYTYAGNCEGFEGDKIKPNYKKKNVHIAEKPINVLKWLLIEFSKENDLVIDCFIGSGTTAVACKQLGRKFIGFEINPEYVKIANKRLAQEVLI